MKLQLNRQFQISAWMRWCSSILSCHPSHVSQPASSHNHAAILHSLPRQMYSKRTQVESNKASEIIFPVSFSVGRCLWYYVNVLAVKTAKGVVSEKMEYWVRMKIMNSFCRASILRFSRGVVNRRDCGVRPALGKIFWEGEVKMLWTWVISQLSSSDCSTKPELTFSSHVTFINCGCTVFLLVTAVLTIVPTTNAWGEMELHIAVPAKGQITHKLCCKMLHLQWWCVCEKKDIFISWNSWNHKISILFYCSTRCLLQLKMNVASLLSCYFEFYTKAPLAKRRNRSDVQICRVE